MKDIFSIMFQNGGIFLVCTNIPAEGNALELQRDNRGLIRGKLWEENSRRYMELDGLANLVCYLERKARGFPDTDWRGRPFLWHHCRKRQKCEILGQKTNPENQDKSHLARGWIMLEGARHERIQGSMLLEEEDYREVLRFGSELELLRFIYTFTG